MHKRRLSSLASSKLFKNHVPGRLLLNSEPLRWKNIALTDFSFPAYLPEGPAPGVADYIFGLVYSGAIKGECSVNNARWRAYTIRHNEFTLWQPFQSMNWRWWPTTESPEPINIAITYLSADLLKKTAIEAMDMEPSLIEMPNHIGTPDLFMQQLVLALQHELKSGNPCGQLYPETAAQLLALHVLSRHCTFSRKSRQYKQGLSKNQLLRILDYINTHWNQDINLDTLATMSGMSTYHFLRKFKKSTNESPLQYIIRTRMKTAKQLLINSNRSITEIALEVGYESVSHFINLFKRQTGLTPLQYRRGF